MHILVVSQYWYPENGVPQRRWSWLSRILADAGHEVTVVAPPPHYPTGKLVSGWDRKTDETGPSGERILRSAFFPHTDRLMSRAFDQAVVSLSGVETSMRTYLRKQSVKPDLVIGTVPSLPTATSTRLIAKSLNVPYVIDLRDAWPDLLKFTDRWNESVATGHSTGALVKSVAQRIVAASSSRQLMKALVSASSLIVTTETFREQLLSRPSMANFGEHKIATVRNVFPRMTFEEYDSGFPDHDALHVIYAGTLGRAQALRHVLEAAHLVQNEGQHIRLRFIGGGAAKSSLQEITSRKGLDVDFLRRVKASQVNDHYRWADTALVNLANWEPMAWTVPSKLYELMELGIHVSGGVNGEAASLVSEHGSGHVVAAEDPEELAQTWLHLKNNRSLLSVDSRGKAWVKDQRENVAPARFLSLIERATQ